MSHSFPAVKAEWFSVGAVHSNKRTLLLSSSAAVSPRVRSLLDSVPELHVDWIEDRQSKPRSFRCPPPPPPPVLPATLYLPARLLSCHVTLRWSTPAYEYRPAGSDDPHAVMPRLAVWLLSALRPADSSHCPLIESLTLSRPITSELHADSARLYPSLSALSSLTALSLDVNQVSGDDLTGLLSVPSSTQRLRHVNLGGSAVRDGDWPAEESPLSSSEVSHTSLTSIVLPQYDPDLHTHAINRLLQRHRQLRHLSLSSNWPQSIALARSLAPTLSCFSRTLTSLDVSGWVADLSALVDRSTSPAALLLPCLTQVSWRCEMRMEDEKDGTLQLYGAQLTEWLVEFLTHYGSRLQCVSLWGFSMQYQRVLEACLACPELRTLYLHSLDDCSKLEGATSEDTTRAGVASPMLRYTPLAQLSAVSLQGRFHTESHLLTVLAAFPAVTHLRLRATQEWTVLPLSLSSLPVISRSCPCVEHVEISQIADTFFLSAAADHTLTGCFPRLETLVVDRMVYQRQPERTLYSAAAVASFVSLLSASPLRSLYLGLSLSLSDLCLLAPLRSLRALGRGQPSSWQPDSNQATLWHPIPARFLLAADETDRRWKRDVRQRLLASKLDCSVGDRERRRLDWSAHVWPSLRFDDQTGPAGEDSRDAFYAWLASGQITETEQQWARAIVRAAYRA